MGVEGLFDKLIETIMNEENDESSQSPPISDKGLASMRNWSVSSNLAELGNDDNGLNNIVPNDPNIASYDVSGRDKLFNPIHGGVPQKQHPIPPTAFVDNEISDYGSFDEEDINDIKTKKIFQRKQNDDDHTMTNID